MEREARAFTVALSNAHKPSLCAACLWCFLDYIHPDGSKENLRILRASQHDFLSAAMVFITTPRTNASREDTRRAIAAVLSNCSNPFGRRNQHAHATRVLFGDSNLLHTLIGDLLGLVVQCLGDSGRRVVLSQRFSSRGLWPCSTEDLLPFGPEESFLSLVHWLAVREDTRVMIAFTDIFLTCRDELGPVIIQDTNRQLFTNAIADQMQAALIGLKKDLAERNFAEPSNLNPLDRIVTLNDVLSNVLRALSHDQQLLSKTPVPLVQGYERLLLNSIEEALPLIEYGPERNRIISVATTLHSSLGTPFVERPGDLQIPSLAVLGESGHAINLVLRLIAKLRRRHHCGVEDCTIRECDVGRRLQRCAGCGILQYCSKDCQRRHWKATEAPHKAVCVTLKRLAPFLDLPQQDFRKEVRTMGLDHDELAFIFVNVQHGNVSTAPQTIEQKVQHTSAMFRMHDSLLGDKDTPPSLNGLRDALKQFGFPDLPADFELVMDSFK